MLLPLTCLKRDFLKVLQSLRGYIDTILPKSLGHIATLAYRQACPEAVVRALSYFQKMQFLAVFRPFLQKSLNYVMSVWLWNFNNAMVAPKKQDFYSKEMVF